MCFILMRASCILTFNPEILSLKINEKFIFITDSLVRLSMKVQKPLYLDGSAEIHRSHAELVFSYRFSALGSKRITFS